MKKMLAVAILFMVIFSKSTFSASTGSNAGAANGPPLEGGNVRSVTAIQPTREELFKMSLEELRIRRERVTLVVHILRDREEIAHYEHMRRDSPFILRTIHLGRLRSDNFGKLHKEMETSLQTDTLSLREVGKVAVATQLTKEELRKMSPTTFLEMDLKELKALQERLNLIKEIAWRTREIDYLQFRWQKQEAEDSASSNHSQLSSASEDGDVISSPEDKEYEEMRGYFTKLPSQGSAFLIKEFQGEEFDKDKVNKFVNRETIKSPRLRKAFREKKEQINRDFNKVFSALEKSLEKGTKVEVSKLAEEVILGEGKKAFMAQLEEALKAEQKNEEAFNAVMEALSSGSIEGVFLNGPSTAISRENKGKLICGIAWQVAKARFDGLRSSATEALIDPLFLSALSQLGSCYFGGHGVDPNNELASKLFEYSKIASASSED